MTKEKQKTSNGDKLCYLTAIMTYFYNIFIFRYLHIFKIKIDEYILAFC